MDLVAVEPQTNFNRATVKSCNLNSSIPPVVLPVRKHELKTKNADEAAHGRHEDGQKDPRKTAQMMNACKIVSYVEVDRQSDGDPLTPAVPDKHVHTW